MSQRALVTYRGRLEAGAALGFRDNKPCVRNRTCFSPGSAKGYLKRGGNGVPIGTHHAVMKRRGQVALALGRDLGRGVEDVANWLAA